MGTKEIIKSGREKLGMSHLAFGNAVGVSRGAVQQWEKGTTEPTRKHQPKIAALLGITVAELMQYTGSLARVAAGLDADIKFAPAPIELEGNPDYPAVRRVSVKAKAGITGYAVENCEDGAPIVFRADWYRTHNYRPERLMALRVAGESMVPSLYPDDLIVVNTESTTPRDGVAFLVAYYGEVAVKRLVMDAGQWWLNSDNSDQRRHPPSSHRSSSTCHQAIPSPDSTPPPPQTAHRGGFFTPGVCRLSGFSLACDFFFAPFDSFSCLASFSSYTSSHAANKAASGQGDRALHPVAYVYRGTQTAR